MQPQFVSGSPLLEAVWAFVILILSAMFAWLILIGLHRMQPRLEKRAKSTPIPRLLESLSRPIVLLVISQGLILALSSLSYLAPWSEGLGKTSVALVIIIATYALAKSGGTLLTWYLGSRAVRRKVFIDQGLVLFLRRIMVLIVYALGILVLLDYLSIAITPIVAGLGIGGLAVALALQPTLGNFFAGTQIVSDRVVRIGDYIELENGTMRGYVTDVGWRSTRIRTTFNNLVIIPNSRLADSIITNYHGPSMELAVIVNAGTSYSSNLADVERVSLEVAREVIQDLDETVKTFEPWFGYDEFGESNINFWVWLQARNRIASFRVKSELIKRLHARFGEEGIEINYPVRKLTYDDSDAKRPLLPPDASNLKNTDKNQ